MADERVQRSEVVNSLTALQSEVLGTAEDNQRSLLGSLAVGAALVIGVAYGLGRRAGRRRSGFIEIRR